MIVLAVMVGAILMAVLGEIPIVGPMIAGFVAGVMVGGIGRGALAGFLSGTFLAVLATIILATSGVFIGGLAMGPTGAAAGGLAGVVMGAGFFIAELYFGILGLVGGIIGGALRKR